MNDEKTSNILFSGNINPKLTRNTNQWGNKSPKE